MYRIGICDDETDICAKIEEIVLLYARKRDVNLDTEVWYSGEGVCEYLKRGNSIDIQ